MLVLGLKGMSLQCYGCIAGIYLQLSKSIYSWICRSTASLWPFKSANTARAEARRNKIMAGAGWVSLVHCHGDRWSHIYAPPFQAAFGFPTGFRLYRHHRAATHSTADGALLHLICALLIFCMRRPGKLTQKLLRVLSCSHGEALGGAAQVRKAFKLHSSPTATTTPQIKTTGARVLINKLMRATKFGMQRLSFGDIKKKNCARLSTIMDSPHYLQGLY